MKSISIFNEVIGPVMRGPSSSHTAGAFHIAGMARSLLGEEPVRARFQFDPKGSFGRVYQQQGADLAFAAGLIGLPLIDEHFPKALDDAASMGLGIEFETQNLPEADHPNTVKIHLRSRQGRTLDALARSIGGGAVEFTRLGGWPILWRGNHFELAVEVESKVEMHAAQLLARLEEAPGDLERQACEGRVLLCTRQGSAFPEKTLAALRALEGVREIWAAKPVFYVKRAPPLFSSAAQMVDRAENRGTSLGRIALEYESTLLGIPEREVLDEMIRRFEVMNDSVLQGLEAEPPVMQLLTPSAGRILASEAAGGVALGGIHTRAAARAMAVMHVSGGMGVVCAAPTAGSAGVLPAVVSTWVEEKGLSRQEAALCLLAAGAVGVVLATRATFAAETAGCQVEIGAAGAMAAAAVVEAVGGSALQAADAAAISFQNTMGSVCDLVQGIVEIPCHTRNAVAASGAFVCADLVLGGYRNPIPLDETIDAVYAVGKMLPRELRCTALGGLARAPSALAMKRLR